MSVKITSDQLPSPHEQGWGVVRLPKGVCPDVKAHSHAFDEYVVMLSGRCIIENAGERFEYSAGDIGLFPRHEAHKSIEALEDSVYIWTRGDSPAE